MKAPEHKLGNRIKSARKAKKLTQEKLAEQINISTSYIAEIENKRTIPSFEIMCSLCKILNLSLDDIIFDTESDSIKQINLLLGNAVKNNFLSSMP